MGFGSLFSSKSNSSSSTSYTDNSIAVDLSSGDLSSGASKNMVAGGSINVDGLSEDMVGKLFDGINSAYGSALDFVSKAVGEQSDNVSQMQAGLAAAYDTQNATLQGLKPYMIYLLVGVVAVTYFRSKK